MVQHVSLLLLELHMTQSLGYGHPARANLYLPQKSNIDILHQYDHLYSNALIIYDGLTSRMSNVFLRLPPTIPYRSSAG